MKHPLLFHPPPFAVPDPAGWGTLSDVVPMGLLSIAESCRLAEFDPLIIQLLDAARLIASVEGSRSWDDGRWRTLVHRVLTEHTPRAVGIQCHWSYQWAGALAVAEWTKAFDPSIHVTFGGVHAGAMAREILESVSVVDSIVIGDGERAYPSLLREIARGPSLTPPAGVLWRDADGHLHGKPHAGPLDENDVPLLTLDPALLWPEDRGRYVGLPFMRGRCPKPCTFCSLNSETLYPMKQRSLEDRLERQLPVFLERSVPLYLPEHFSGPKPLEALGVALSRMGRASHVLVDVHPGMINARTAEALVGIAKNADRLRLWLGVESGSERVRRLAGRTYGDEEILGAFEILSGAGLAPLQSSLMVGLPGETEEDLLASDRMIATLNGRGILTNVLPVVAFPETAIYREAAAFGLTLRMRSPGSFANLSRGWHAPIAPEAISVESLSLDAHARIEATLKLRLRQRVRLGYRVTPELFRTMEHLPGERVVGESEAMVERYEPLLRGPRFGGPVVPTRFWGPPS